MKSLTPQEIIEWKKRQGKPRKATDLVAQVAEMRATWAGQHADERYLGDFIIVRLVTILEVFTRGVVAELVDSDVQEFFDRARNLVKDRKLDFLFADSIAKEELTLGDIVAHALSINNLDGLLAVFQALIPDLGRELPISHPRWAEEADAFPLEPIIKDYDQTKLSIKRLFEIRHVVVHEMPAELPYGREEIDRFCEAVSDFVSALDWLTVKLIENTIPYTQSRRTLSAVENVELAQGELQEVLKLAAAIEAIDGGKLQRSQEAWLDFAKRESELYAHKAEGGTLYPALYGERFEELIRYRIEDLVDFIEDRHKL